MAVHVRLDMPPHFAHLNMWGRAAGGGWWALVTWDRHVGYDDPPARCTGTRTCAGWVAAGHVTPADGWVDTSAIPRVLSVVDLADDAVIGVADDLGVRGPRPLVADGALVVWVMGCSAW